jgi:CubicO group peptidase (beta-lactamase class C family)
MIHRASASVLVPGLVLLLAAASPSRLRAQLPAGFEAAWNDVSEEWHTSVRQEGVVGASLALVHDGRLVRLETEGMADLVESRPIDESTIYHWASITKTFTAIAIMQLRDRGLLTLEDPIVDYVPELRDVHNPFGSMEEVTLRHLLTHSAGFRASTWPWGGDREWHPHEPTEWSQLVSMMPYTEILFEPGSRYSYSNPGIIFLGRVIEKVSGDVYEAYIDKNIFRPLGMLSSYFDVTPWHLLDRRSNHYFVRNGEPRPGGLDFNTGITVSNGGLNAPVTDMARYLAFLIGDPVDGADYEAVLARSSLQEMWEPQVQMGSSSRGDLWMGLSFFLGGEGRHRTVGHTGSQRAFFSFFYIEPEASVGVLAAFNTVSADATGPDTDRLRVLTTRRVMDDVFPLFR